MHRYSYLALGDSYTIGESIPALENYPSQTVGLLRAQGFDFHDPIVIAKTGWTSFELINAIEKKVVPLHFDFVTLLVGVNNQYRGLPPASFGNDLSLLVKMALDFSGNRPERVIILSIPDWGATPFATLPAKDKISEEIQIFNTICKAQASQSGIHYINITSDSLQVTNDPSLLASDQLHYSGKMYKIWATKIAERIEAMLP